MFFSQANETREPNVEELKQQLKESQNKLKIADKIISKSEKSRRTLITQNLKLKRCNKVLREERKLKSKDILRKVFNNDQIEWLQSDFKKRRIYKWSTETIKKALRVRFSCTENGYKELINQNIPLPSTRTLRRSLEGINFPPGICDDIFQALKDKVALFNDDRQKDCMIGLDEVSLVEGERIDPSTNSITGYITIPNREGKISS